MKIFDIFSGKRQHKNVSKNNNQKNTENANTNQKVSDEKKKTSPLRVTSKAFNSRRGVRRASSTESVFSISTIGTQEIVSSRLRPENEPPRGQTIYDNCAYVIFCAEHNKICVSKEEKSKAVWLPFISLDAKRTWSDGSIEGAIMILCEEDASLFAKFKAKPPFSEAHCLQVFRLQLPQTQKFINRLIYYIKLDSSDTQLKCCQNTKRIEWLALSEVTSATVDNLWGPEVCQFSRCISGPIVQNINEYSLDQALYYVPRDPPRNLEEKMLKSANITEKDVERLYGDFIEHCFPSFFLTKHSFKDYMSKYGFERNDSRLQQLFTAFNFNNNGFISFHELLIGLASIEPITRHAQSRVKFVFKYFDVDRDGFLSESEFRKMVHEISLSEKKNYNQKTIDQKTKEGMKAIGVKKNGIAFDDFYKAVGAKKFRGTSGLCRSSKPIFSQISRSMASRTLKKTTAKTAFSSIIADRKYKAICMSCKQKKYSYATHSVKIGADGKCCQPIRLVELESINADKSEQKTDSSIKTSQSTDEDMSRRKYSIEVVFNPKSLANSFLEEMRAFNSKKGTYNSYNGLMSHLSQREQFVKQLELLCKEVEKIVSSEERCVKVRSPTFVIGDIHGNLEDLLSMETVLWKSVPLVAANYVFLGDYVDRGKWGLECALYVFCLKLIAPKKFILLRGNHEVRDLQLHYSYKKECLHKYGDHLGPKVWEITNRVFDRLPICAVVDDSIFCVHGGIPASTSLIDQINQIKTDLRDPERESAIAWEMMWSDPCGAQQFAEVADLLQIRIDSPFLANTKRGTAFFYSEQAVNHFLQNNGLTHIIRAHEVPANGFTFHFGNKCTTIFSCSHYCGNNNEAACIHIHNQKLRIIRFDTVNNAPATDPN